MFNVEFLSLGHARAIADSSLFTLHSSLFVLQSYEESLTQIPVMIHLGALMIHL